MNNYFINTENPKELYSRYAKVYEQAAVISDDAHERIKQYLDNEDLLEKLADEFRSMEDGSEATFAELQISGSEYGIMSDDIIHVRKEIGADSTPKFTMWIMNEEFMYGDVDFDNAAFLLHQASEYAPAGKVLGTVGNYIGSIFGYGDPGDAGTDEEGLIGVAGALTQIASEKNLDPKLYFDKLSSTYASKYGESVEDMLTTEFSGRAESVALNLFRQPIAPSASRGFNLGAFLLDVGLTVATFGMGTIAKSTAVPAANLTAKMAQAGNVATKTTRLGKAGARLVRVGEAGLTGLRAVVARIPGWRGLTSTQKWTHLGKVIKGGDTVMHTYKGVLVPHKVIKVGGSVNGVQLLRIANKSKNIPGGSKFAVASGDFLLKTSPKLANSILDKAGLAATAIALTTADANLSKHDVGETGYNSGFLAGAGEVMGWYDGISADPNQFLDQVKDGDPSTLAEILIDLREGSGLFGNTTNQEELQMALIITSLTPENARKVMEQYSKKGGGPISALLDDELGGDMSMMAVAYWAACTGDGIKSVPHVAKSYAGIKKKK
jgi:hypothetical protein